VTFLTSVVPAALNECICYRYMNASLWNAYFVVDIFVFNLGFRIENVV
jgi:hypothetical protein